METIERSRCSDFNRILIGVNLEDVRRIVVLVVVEVEMRGEWQGMDQGQIADVIQTQSFLFLKHRRKRYPFPRISSFNRPLKTPDLVYV